MHTDTFLECHSTNRPPWPRPCNERPASSCQQQLREKEREKAQECESARVRDCGCSRCQRSFQHIRKAQPLPKCRSVQRVGAPSSNQQQSSSSSSAAAYTHMRVRHGHECTSIACSVIVAVPSYSPTSLLRKKHASRAVSVLRTDAHLSCCVSVCVQNFRRERAREGKHGRNSSFQMRRAIALMAFNLITVFVDAAIWKGGREASSTCLPSHHPAHYNDKPCPSITCKCIEGGLYQSCDWCKEWSCESSSPTSDCTPLNHVPPRSHTNCKKDCNCWCDGGICPKSCRSGQCTCQVCDSYGNGNMNCDRPWHGEL